MTSNLDQFLKGAEERCEKATEGPWDILSKGPNPIIAIPCAIGNGKIGIIPSADCNWSAKRNDLEFIANARLDLPLALKVLRIAVEALEYADMAGSSEATKTLAEIEEMVRK